MAPVDNAAEELERLFDEQKYLIQNLSDIIRNYRADGKERKKEPAYYVKKLKQLEDWWTNFDKNDAKLREIGNPQDAYFADKSYDRTKEIYERQRETILNNQTELNQKLEERQKRKTGAQPNIQANETTNPRASTSAAMNGETSGSTDEQNAEKTTTKAKGPFADFETMENLFDNDEKSQIYLSDDEESDETNNSNGVPDSVKVYFFLA